VPILPNLQGPADLRGLDELQLAQLAVEIRETILRTVARTGGHLGSSLGVVELTIALHRLLESPRDRIVWDTGHQAYPHKLLTGRLERFGTLRQLDGVGGFPRRSESPHDVFDGGHAGTGLSIAEGLAEARDLRHGLERIVVVVGDAALMSGLSLEALNDIGQRQTQMLIVLNDNEMSISPTVGAFSKYLSQIKLSRTWRQGKSAYDSTVERIPFVGGTVLELSRRLRKSVVSFAQPGQLFEDLGITYIGVVPGHDLHALLETLGRALTLPGPTIVHVRPPSAVRASACGAWRGWVKSPPMASPCNWLWKATEKIPAAAPRWMGVLATVQVRPLSEEWNTREPVFPPLPNHASRGPDVVMQLLLAAKPNSPGWAGGMFPGAPTCQLRPPSFVMRIRNLPFTGSLIAKPRSRLKKAMQS